MSSAPSEPLRDLPATPLALLAGGLGTRVRQISTRIPKALFDVAGRPFIAHQLAHVHRQGVRRVVICTGHLGYQIEACVGDGRSFGLEVVYSRDGERPLGTGGALKQAAPLLGDVFWVMYGDAYLEADFAAIHRAFRTSPALGLMTVFRNDNRLDRSNVVFRDGRLLEYDKRAPRLEMTHIDYGLALLRGAVLVPEPAGEAFDLADLYHQLVSRGAMDGYEVKRRFYEIGSPEGLAETRVYLERGGAPP